DWPEIQRTHGRICDARAQRCARGIGMFMEAPAGLKAGAQNLDWVYWFHNPQRHRDAGPCGKRNPIAACALGEKGGKAWARSWQRILAARMRGLRGRRSMGRAGLPWGKPAATRPTVFQALRHVGAPFSPM